MSKTISMYSRYRSGSGYEARSARHSLRPQSSIKQNLLIISFIMVHALTAQF